MLPVPAPSAALPSAVYALHSEGHRQLITQSHGRSQAFGLQPRERPDFAPLRQRQMDAQREENRRLFQHASPVMETLYEQIANTHSMVLLTSSSGLILHSLGDADFLEKASQVALMPGVDWSEQTRGTNAIGTALTEGQPVVVHGSDHFLQANQFLTCSCAPIYEPCGKLVGALDVTGDQRSYHQHTMALVRMSAQMIENHMFDHMFVGALRIHFHARPEFLNTLVEGIVVFTQEGRFLSANRSAQFQLGLSVNALQAHTFGSLFGQSVSQFHDRTRLHGQQPVSLCMHNGVSVFCLSKNKPAQAWFGSHDLPAAAQDTAHAPPAPAAPHAFVSATRASALSGRGRCASLHDLNTGDPQVAALLHKLQRVQNNDIPIMVLGETGTGKDILAQAIHSDSARAQMPFVSINCASIPDSLIESELFGYEEGAFTGAKRKGALGKIQMAHGGTLFLDEIGDMPTQLQARLLRVLQERRVTPLGSGKAYEVDVMLICATNKNLKTLIAQGQFREDLYYRLNGLVVRLPALRERADFDVVAHNILQSLCAPGQTLRISEPVMALFRSCPWPGNIRQLHNLLRTAAVMVGAQGEIGVGDLPDDFMDDLRAAPPAPMLPPEPLLALDALGNLGPLGLGCAAAGVAAGTAPAPTSAPVSAGGSERLHDVALVAMAQALRDCRGNVSAAAKRLGVSRNTIYRKKAELPADLWH